jgi:hypothetical protein
MKRATFPGRGDEGRDKPQVGGILLGMPLHTDNEVAVIQLYRFYCPVRGPTCDSQPWSELVERLVMVAVHADSPTNGSGYATCRA